MKLVTSYPKPDLDGTACLVAYSELLEKKGEEAVGASFEKPDGEALFLQEELNIDIPDATDYLDNSEIVIVDASFPDGVSDEIDLEKVVEVIDHRKNHKAESFPNAEIDVQLVGAAATLIGERFRKEKAQISKESANMLYAAIKDNTVNFQANVTTERDRKAAKWLEENAEVNKELCQKIFEVKSEKNPVPRKIVPDDYYATTHHGKKIGVSQIESLYTQKFIEENQQEIKEVLKNLKRKQNLDYGFLTSIDIQKGKNYIVAADSQTREMLTEALGLEFEENMAEKEEMLLRKEIMPKIKQNLSGKN